MKTTSTTRLATRAGKLRLLNLCPSCNAEMIANPFDDDEPYCVDCVRFSPADQTSEEEDRFVTIAEIVREIQSEGHDGDPVRLVCEVIERLRLSSNR